MADKYNSVTKTVTAVQFTFDNLKEIYLFTEYRDVTYSVKNRNLSGIITGKDNEKLSVQKNDFIVKDSEKNIFVMNQTDFNKNYIIVKEAK